MFCQIPLQVTFKKQIKLLIMFLQQNLLPGPSIKDKVYSLKKETEIGFIFGGKGKGSKMQVLFKWKREGRKTKKHTIKAKRIIVCITATKYLDYIHLFSLSFLPLSFITLFLLLKQPFFVLLRQISSTSYIVFWIPPNSTLLFDLLKSLYRMALFGWSPLVYSEALFPRQGCLPS